MGDLDGRKGRVIGEGGIMGGRPTKYKAEYCDIAQSVLGAGEGMAAVADEIGVTKSTVYLWAERHGDF